MEVQKTHFGFSDEELKALPTVYRADLFSGKTVVVSGGGSGFGKAIACLLARLGANVAIGGRNEEKLAATVPLLESMDVRVFSAPLTKRDPDRVNSFITMSGTSSARSTFSCTMPARVQCRRPVSANGANPMLRVGDAHDIAEAVAYLASPDAKFITGEVLTVDGGEQLWGDPWSPDDRIISSQSNA